ncbi:MAG TPA: START domain-containing protein [Polyangia bacterium]|nr:START domain-containing protein [Polyangia bacterium]
MWALAIVLLGLAAELPPPLPPADDARAWQPVKVVEGIVVTRAPLAPPPQLMIWGAAEGDIDAPIDRVIAHLTNFELLPKIVPRLAELRVLSRASDEAILYFRFDLPWPISDRDWTSRYRWRREGDRFVMTWSDVSDRGPPPGKAVRVSPLRGAWELTSLGPGRTHARYVSLENLGGHLPRSVIEQTSWKQPLETFRAVRRALSVTGARPAK